MAARVSQKVGQEANPGNFLLMHAMGPNVAGVIGSAIAAGVLISLFGYKGEWLLWNSYPTDPLYITDTILRDAHQSQAATRMRLEDMLPACEVLDSIGYWSLECWGGATFDACMRFLNEDPWERLRPLRKALPHTKLQMLFRGQNILGYKHYADDVVDAFCAKSPLKTASTSSASSMPSTTCATWSRPSVHQKYGGMVEATCPTPSPPSMTRNTS